VTPAKEKRSETSNTIKEDTDNSKIPTEEEKRQILKKYHANRRASKS